MKSKTSPKTLTRRTMIVYDHGRPVGLLVFENDKLIAVYDVKKAR